MSEETLQRTVRVAEPQGLHLRPATAFAQTAGRFQSTVTLSREGQKVNGKSPLELILLGAEHGSELTLEVSGPDAAAALDALTALLTTPSHPADPGDAAT